MRWRWRRLGAWVAATLSLRTFSAETEPRPIDRVIAEMAGRGGMSVSRREALSVPAVQKGRNMICAISTLPLYQLNARGARVDNPFLAQIDPDVANVVTLAQTLEDLIFDGISWWRVTKQDSQGFPIHAMHLDVGSVSVDPPEGRSVAPLPSGVDPRSLHVWVDGKPVLASQIIRFDSPNPAVRHVAGNAIRRARLLDIAAAAYANNPRPLDHFTPAESAEELNDDEVEQILATWQARRKKYTTAWIPRSMKYQPVDSPTPQELQIVELQKQVWLELANSMGVDPEDIGVSTTSRTYNNAIDRRRDRINDTSSPYMLAITQRLSMVDVTRRGHRVLFDLNEYMRANPTERWGTYKTGRELGAITVEEIREAEGLPPLAPAELAKAAPAPPPVPAPPAKTEDDNVPANNSRGALAGFRFAADGPSTLHLVDLPTLSLKVDRETRIIEGVAMPYGVVITKLGMRFRFLPNSIVWNQRAPGRVKLLEDHDMDRPIGYAKGLNNVGNELRTRWKVGRGPAGDAALMSAEDGVRDGLSVGVDIDFETDVTVDDDGVVNVHHAVMRETSLTAMPAFDDARVTSVAASRNDGRNTMDQCATCGHRHAPDVACPITPPANNNGPAPEATPSAAPTGVQLTAEQQALLLSQPGALTALITQQQAAAKLAQPAPGALTFSPEQVTQLINSGHLGTLLGVPQVTAPQPPAETAGTVDPTRRTPAAVSAVKEELPYRFDRAGNLMKGVQYDFSTDIIRGAQGDTEAMERATAFVKAMSHKFVAMPTNVQFDVDQADAATLNPARQRPDLYVDQKEFAYPMWDAVNKGTIADATPFVLPKFSSSSGLVAAHTEGVEPTPGTFVATSQTVTPTPNSGKVEITREAWDQGGNPQLSGIIWRQMQRAWFESLEAAVVTLLDSLTPTGIPLTTGAVDDQLVGELEQALAALQYVRGGMRMRDFFIQIDLYKKLTDAKDADGRKLLPLLGAVNANGQVSELFADINIAGLRGRPGWALAATGTVAASSYLFDRNDVHGWATPPQRLQFEYRVAYVDVAVWGYKALANTDLTGVREVTYDPQ